MKRRKSEAMKLRNSALIAVDTLASAFAATAQAQTAALHLGPRLSYHCDTEEVGLGMQRGIPIANRLEFYPSIDNCFVNAGSFVSLNADLKRRVPVENTRWLYLGGELSITSIKRPGRSSNTDAGLNLFVGAESLAGRVHPFGELRIIANNGSNIQGAFGLNFTLHK
jgi:hypothetical protein